MRHTLPLNPARLPAAAAYNDKPVGALLPALPPHASSSPRNNTRVAMFTLAPPADADGGWQLCLGGGNTLPVPMRLTKAADRKQGI